MNLSFLRTPEDITAKWELAERMVGQSNMPNEALACVFKGAMNSLEERAGQRFDESLENRVWSKVSPESLRSLREFFLMEVIDGFFRGVNTREAEAMLKEYQRGGSLESILYRGGVPILNSMRSLELTSLVAEKAELMAIGWIPKIFEAVREEGIVFPG
jgi:hypothetical protein